MWHTLLLIAEIVKKQSALHSSRTDGVGPIFESEEKRLFPLRFPSFFVSLQKI
jgi:hypothetical protein